MIPQTKNFANKKNDFTHLHLHTDYSLLQGAIQLKPLANKLKDLNMDACAITDYGNMFGAISFYNTMKANEIQPILGYEAILTLGSRFDRDVSIKAGELPYYHLVLLAKDLEGYYNLCYLASKAYTEGFHYKPRIDLEILQEKSRGLIALTSGLKGVAGHYLSSGNFEKALNNLELLKDIFGKNNIFIEIQDHGLEAEKKITRGLAELSQKTGIPLVATNDAHYLTQEDFKAHDILLCIGEGKTINDGTRKTLGNPNFYLRSAEEMWHLFGNEVPNALHITKEIAEMCRVELPLTDNLALPDFPIPVSSECKNTYEYFEEVIYEGFEKRRETIWNPLKEQGRLKYTLDDYQERIESEIKIIKDMGFPGYFLIVWDFMKYARTQDIPVGPGRGSAAGSLVAYCLEITDIDPIQYDLLFERFLNPERVSMPDIDIDFCIRGRAEVIRHVTEFYGQDSVCQIITFGTMASRAAIKDVGRALSMPYADVEKIAKLIPPPVRGRNVSISEAIEQVPELSKLFKQDKDVKEVLDLARRLEGCGRHSSVHAAGVVISPKPLHELIPIAVSSRNDELTSQYSMNDLEKVGMLKMDFLALTTLTVISDCLKMLKDKTGIEIEWHKISLEDKKTMEIFSEGRTEAVFQFESEGMQEICRRLKPKELEDLAALNALYRPGPLDGGMVDDFIARHRGEKSVRYIVPEMKGILQNTYGVLVYQEQIMQLAQQLAGYTLGEADLMRRAMGKKKRSEMALHEEKFIEGAVKRGIKRKKAEEIYNLMAQFADYGFNRSHSVAYAYIAFQTAYLKAHYPAYFYASVLSHEANDAKKIYKYSNELKNGGLELLPPDVNESDVGFTPLDNAVRFGLTAIKGIGVTGVEAIIQARIEKGKFSSLFDFAAKIRQGSVNRRALESLIAAGSFDSLNLSEQETGMWRARLYNSVNMALSHGQRIWNDKMRGQTALFGGGDFKNTDVQEDLPDTKAWSPKELSQMEKSSVGFYLSTHPLDSFGNVLTDLKIKSFADYEDIMPGDVITVAGLISKFQIKHSKKGNRFCIFRLEDRSSGAKCLVWAETLGKFADILKDDEIIIVKGKVESFERQELTLIIEDVKSLSEMVFVKANRLHITLPQKDFDEILMESIVSLLSVSRGSCDVYLNLQIANNIKTKIYVEPLRISGSSNVEKELKALGCKLKWELN
ncbi:MAG: DNA polymerase III subunit alpha [Aridibacter sp.]